METILIVDDDLGFVFWLGQTLDAAGYSAFPAKSAPDAALLISQLNLNIDVAVIDTALSGAIDFIGWLRRAQPDVRAIGIDERGLLSAQIPQLDLIRRRPGTTGADDKAEWVRSVERLLGKTVDAALAHAETPPAAAAAAPTGFR